MNFLDLTEHLIHDTVDVSLPSFLPETVLCITMMVVLLARLPRATAWINSMWIALAGTIVALVLGAPWLHLRPQQELAQGKIEAVSVDEAGGIRVAADTAGLATGDYVEVSGVPGVAADANRFQITVVDEGHFDLAKSEFAEGAPAGATFRQISDPNMNRGIFTGMLIYDPLTVYFRAFLLGFAVLLLLLTWLTGVPDFEAGPDFYTLVLGGTLGMCLMASANHMLMVFIAVEMASVPSYALAGLLKGRRTASEAALKYAVYGAGTAGIMLYGISLLAGSLGSAHIPTMAAQLAAMPADAFAERQTVLLLGGLMVAVGLAFKLSAVPFHFWCPDVFEGATAEVNAFLSVASKGAALALLLRVAIGFSHVPTDTAILVAQADGTAPQLAAADANQEAATRTPIRLAAHQEQAGAKIVPAPGATPADEAAADKSPLAMARNYMVGLITLIAALTCTLGNLAAYAQTNIKRLLAYSTIAHAGYMMMPVAAVAALIGHDDALARDAISAVCFYVAVYLFMNLGAFAIVAFLRNEMHSEEIKDYAGLVRSAPGMAIWLSVILISLLGIPPLVGFWAKVQAFVALVAGGAYSPILYLLLVIGGLNTVISLFYYVRVVKIMTLDPEPEDRRPVHFSIFSSAAVYVTLVSAPVVVLGIFWNQLNEWAQAAAAQLLG